MDRISTITEEATGKTTEYTYDGAGNRLTKSITEQGKTITTEYTYDSFDHLMKEKSDDGTTILYNYDKDGNQISRLTENGKGSTGTANGSVSGASLVIVSVSGTNGTGSSELTLYRYDSFNRLISVKQGDTTSTYTYDPADYRTSSTVNGVTTYSCYENGKLKAEADGTKTVTAVNHYGLVLYARETLTESYYYLYNAHRDVVMLVYTQGGIAATYQYDAFGNILKTTGNADNTTTYAGYQYDESTGLYYVNARYYDSTTARFLTEDSYTGEKNDPLSLNRYTYCVNNPLKYYDPSGHIAVAVTDQLDEKSTGGSSSSSGSKSSTSSINSGLLWLIDFSEGIVDEVGNLVGNIIAIGKGDDDGRSWNENIDYVVEDTWFYDWFCDATKNEELEEFFFFFGFYVDDEHIYHTRQYMLIQGIWFLGYNDLYDYGFDLATDMRVMKFPFECGGDDYVLWAWKGDYLNLGAGAEMGIYKGMIYDFDGNPIHWEIDKSLSMPMTLRLEYNGETIIDYNPQEDDPYIYRGKSGGLQDLIQPIQM